MKQLINIILLFTILSCKAQSIIVPLNSGQDYEFTSDYYLKDVDNEFDKFEGTWIYQNGTDEITFKLKKEEHYQTSSNSEYEDLLVGEYRYIENGIEKVNTLLDIDNPLVLGYVHKINGGVFLHRLPANCIDNSFQSEVKVSLFINHPTEEHVEGRLILRYVNENGVEKLQVCIYDSTTIGEDLNTRIDIPDGYYEFLKQ